MIYALSVTVAIPSAAMPMSVHASKTDKEADDTVKWNHNYRLWIVSATLFRLDNFLLDILPRSQKYCTGCG